MDYKKAYEDALERAKKSLETAKTFDYEDEKIARDIRETVYSIFTELKDSDDEIRRELISLFQDCIDCKNHPYNASDSRRWIAWLEKQGNVKFSEVSIEHGKYYYCIKDYYSGGNLRAKRGDVVQALRGMSIMILDSVEAGKYFLPVNKIEKQGEQKSVVWSEEDEKMLNQVKQSLYRYQDHLIGSPLADDVEIEINWLKSLKPQSYWKPTEEQISMLLAVLNDSNNITAESVCIALKSLYNDLKKL